VSGFDLKDYVDVAERVRLFHAKYPEASIQSEVIELTRDRVVVRSFVYRTPDDPRPSSGMSMMNIPGSTPYTRGSEVENTETSAVGRAIAMAGFATKGSIASADEIRNKQHTTSAPAGSPPSPAGASTDEAYASGKVSRGRAPVDMSLRQTPDGHAFGFVIEEAIEGREHPRKTQVVALDALANVMASIWDQPAEADVWGELVMVPWEKDGKAMPPYRRIIASRVMTSEWTLPAQDAPVPAAEEKVDDLDKLPF
jgi:hypothetical protein